MSWLSEKLDKIKGIAGAANARENYSPETTPIDKQKEAIREATKLSNEASARLDETSRNMKEIELALMEISALDLSRVNPEEKAAIEAERAEIKKAYSECMTTLIGLKSQKRQIDDRIDELNHARFTQSQTSARG